MRGAWCAWRRAWLHTWKTLALPYLAEHGPQIYSRLSCRLGHSLSGSRYVDSSRRPSIGDRRHSWCMPKQLPRWLTGSLEGFTERKTQAGALRLGINHRRPITGGQGPYLCAAVAVWGGSGRLAGMNASIVPVADMATAYRAAFSRMRGLEFTQQILTQWG